MKAIRIAIVAIAILIVAASGLMAATWTWSTPYDNVTGYRYQIGSENEDGWVYVGKDVKSLTLDASESTTVYVQLSVDGGRTWSPSGYAVYNPPAAQPVVVDEEEVPPVAVVSAVPINVEKSGLPFRFSFGLGVGTEYMDYRIALTPVLSFDFKNVASPADFFALDIGFDVAGLFVPSIDFRDGLVNALRDIGNTKFAMGASVDLALYMKFRLSNIELALGGGGGANVLFASTMEGLGEDFLPTLYENDLIGLNAYALAAARFGFYFSDVVHIDGTYKFKYMFDRNIADSKMAHGVTVSLGFAF